MEYIINKKMVPPTKVKMILNGSSNGIDLSKYGTNSIDENRRNFLKNKYEVKDDEFIFLAVGRMVNDKGIIELVEAFLKISSQVSDVRLFLLGPFERGDALPEPIVKLITEHPAITHVDWSDEVESFMAFCHCLVHSSHREGFPNVLLQAGAMGVPIICSNIAGNIDIVETESEGYRFKVKDTKDLQLTMETVLRGYSSSLVKASVLQKKIVARYGRKAVHEAIKERYIFLLKEKRIDVSEIC
jgi:glycosyltransferase involved in cell wall biosynthesis